MIYGSIPNRIFAFLIDLIILAVMNIILSAFIGILYFAIFPNVEDNPFLAIFNFILIWLYFSLSESSSKQASFGKQALKLKITDLDGRRISFGKATIRFFSSILSLITVFVGFLICISSTTKQALQDRISGTFVISNIPKDHY